MINVLIVDDHAIVRQGLKQILADTPDLIVAGEAGTGREALNQVRSQAWDVVVLDISLPDRNGLEVLQQIQSSLPELPVLILTMHAEEQYAVRALRMGAAGYLSKESAPEQLVAAIRKVAGGGRYVSPVLAEQLAFEVGRAEPKPPHQRLSDREFQVLDRLVTGKPLTDIAAELCVSVKTISTYRTRILEKMSLKCNAELVQYAIQHGLVPMLPETTPMVVAPLGHDTLPCFC
jgi:two-component system invasion response regulator UvrY